MCYYVCSLIALVLLGCASGVVEVGVPIRCDIPMPTQEEINLSGDKQKDAINVINNEVRYRMELENALRFCINGE